MAEESQSAYVDIMVHCRCIFPGVARFYTFRNARVATLRQSLENWIYTNILDRKPWYNMQRLYVANFPEKFEAGTTSLQVRSIPENGSESYIVGQIFVTVQIMSPRPAAEKTVVSS